MSIKSKSGMREKLTVNDLSSNCLRTAHPARTRVRYAEKAANRITNSPNFYAHSPYVSSLPSSPKPHPTPASCRFLDSEREKENRTCLSPFLAPLPKGATDKNGFNDVVRHLRNYPLAGIGEGTWLHCC